MPLATSRTEALDPRLNTLDRGTRRWARVGMVAILLSILLPNLWLEAGSGLHIHGFWEDPERSLDYPMAPVLHPDRPLGLVYWAILVGFAWRLSRTSSLLRCGILWTAATVLADRVASGHRWASSVDGGSIPWPLEWPQFGFFCAALGLILISTHARPTVGRAICLYGGLYVLGSLVMPPDADLHTLHSMYDYDPSPGEFWPWVFRLLWLLLGALLVCIGVRHRLGPGWVRAAGWILLLTIAAGLWSDYVQWGLNVRDDQLVPWQARVSSLYVHVRLWLRPYGALTLLVAGVFAWIVAARRTSASHGANAVGG
jgi:hypothetical protein